MKLVVIILTLNEQMHIKRCIESVRSIASEVFIIDCFSDDGTVKEAKAAGATVLQHKWINHSDQFNWALSQLPKDTDWVLRLDADETLQDALVTEINTSLPFMSEAISGVSLPRRITFQGKLLRFGGIFPAHILRLFRYGRGKCEDRWMDEHIIVDGDIIGFKNGIIDDNLKPIGWWIDKHNGYASKEALEILNSRWNFLKKDESRNLRHVKQAFLKRLIKNTVYSRVPFGVRAFIYFLYRYFIRLGFLDGRSGFAFHFLQGFWYRYLVDLKVNEVERLVRDGEYVLESAIVEVLGVKLK
ncbi:glycosyltransferase family 2 protein [Pseudomonadales bacterium]|jgi:glycosyltransferase involved in cell wall biosynthesis|nr:glycosyltransferase family 2 protein [Pseudomonadales bacterium]